MNPARASVLALLAAAAPLALCACELPSAQHLLTDEHLQKRWLPPIQDGTTPLSDIIARLGEPTVYFENRRIAGYHLVLVEDEKEIPAGTSWSSGDLYFCNDESTASMYADRIQQIDARGTLSVVRPGDTDHRPLRLAGRAAELSLVLEVEPAGTISRHSVVRVWP